MSRFGPPFPRFLKAGDPRFQQGGTPDHLLVIDLENYHFNSGPVHFSGNTFEWFQVSDPLCGNSAFMATSPDLGIFAGPDDVVPFLQFRVDFSVSGTHYFWIRTGPLPLQAAFTSDSIHLRIDQTHVLLANSITYPYTWNRFGPFTVPSSGPHTLEIYMREDGAHLDRIALTTCVDYQPYSDSPDEIGPPESPRA